MQEELVTETSPDQQPTRRALRAQRERDAAPPEATVAPVAAAPVRLALGAPAAADGPPRTADVPPRAKTVPPRAATAAPRASRAPRPSRRRRVGAMLLSVAAVGVVGLVAVGMTSPASAVAAADGTGIRHAASTDSATYARTLRHDQDFHADAVAETALSRDSFKLGSGVARTTTTGSTAGVDPVSVTDAGLYANGSMILTAAQMLADNGYNATSDLGYNAAGWGSNPSPIPAGFLQVSNKYFVNDPGGAVQWPFAVGCPITYGFGWRPGEFHEGADFTPGDGAPIQSIADGTVSMATDNFQGYGAVVVIDHVVDGQRVASLYAHLTIGSIRVVAGQHVKVGQEIAQVGASGHAFGANMHFEILANGTTPVDPVGWLRTHAGP
jgi:murein DD-endopeptidase MepM/ murein hydrolase activator NlpD